MSDRFPYHVVARSNNREAFPLPIQICWSIFIENLAAISNNYGVKPIAFVLMPNHFHLLIHTPMANLGMAMNYFMRESSKQMGRIGGRINHVFGGRHRPCIITQDSHFANAYKYLFRNPVAVKLCQRVEQYPFSSLCYEQSDFPPVQFDLKFVIDHSVIPEQIDERLRWLNEPYLSGTATAVRIGLRRSIFGFPKSRDFKRVVDGLTRS